MGCWCWGDRPRVYAHYVRGRFFVFEHFRIQPAEGVKIVFGDCHPASWVLTAKRRRPHEDFFKAGGASTAEIAGRIQAYGSAVSDVLIDPSAGRGLEFSLAGSTELALYQILCTEDELKLGFAGGFDGDNVTARVQEIIDLTGRTDFSIDVESQVRDRLSERDGDDVLSLEKARRYLQATAVVLS